MTCLFLIATGLIIYSIIRGVVYFYYVPLILESLRVVVEGLKDHNDGLL